jgi:hypothetical protein
MVEYINILIGFLLSIILLFTGIDKLLNQEEHIKSIGLYKLLHLNLIKPILIFFIMMELYLGIAYLLGYTNWINTLLFIALIGIYTAAVAINIYRGNTKISCGCGSFLQNEQLSIGIIFRNIVLIIFSILIVITEGSNTTQFFEKLLIFASALSVFIFYGISSKFLYSLKLLNRMKRKLAYFQD